MVQLKILEVVLIIFHSTTCQKESHRVYSLQDAYLQSTPTTPLKNAVALALSLNSLPNSCFEVVEFRPTFENL
jgi:hypothetical protein